MLKQMSIIHNYLNKSLLFSLIVIPFLLFYSIQHNNLFALSIANFYIMYAISQWLAESPDRPENKNFKWISMAILYPLTTALFYYNV